MSAKQHSNINCQLVNLSLKAIFPQYESKQTFNIFHELIRQVLPNFDSVEFILAEILELQRYESKATTHIYSGFNQETNAALIDDYIKIINSIIEVRGWTLSMLDNLYFGKRIWCAHLRSAEAANDSVRIDEPKQWYESTPKKLSLNYEEKQERQEKEIEEMFQDYLRELYSLCLHRYAHSYVLLIPISLNALEEPSQYKAKLGAIFLHFSTSDEVSEQDLRRIYSRILLFWHYYFTSELVGKRQREIEQLKVVQELFTSVQEHTNDIRNILHKLQQPLLNLEIALSPVCGLIYGGESLEKFFQSAGSPIQLIDGMAPIKPIHDWSYEVVKMPEGLKRYQDLTAAIIFKVLGLVESINPSLPLWEQLCRFANESISSPKQMLMVSIVEYIPELRIEHPSPEQIRKVFKTLKAWFNDAYKPQSEDHGSLPYSFLAMALKSMNCRINFSESSDHSFWTASKRPIETIDALAVLHDMKIIKEAMITRKHKDKHLLEIWMEKSHNMNEIDAGKLDNSLQNALNSHNSGNMPRQGNMTYVFFKLFGARQIKRDGLVFSFENANSSRRLSVFFDDNQSRKDKISIEWVGRVFS